MIDKYCFLSIESNLPFFSEKFLLLKSSVNVLAPAFGGNDDFNTRFGFPANFNEAVAFILNI